MTTGARPADSPRATLLLINPGARRGGEDHAGLLDRISSLGPLLEPEGGDQRGWRGAIEAGRATACRIVVGGGDGSLGASLPGLLEAGLPVGLLPLGTANDFARSLGIDDLDIAVAAIVGGRTRAVDVGRVNGIPFLNAAGVGLGPRITRELDSRAKTRFGVAVYFLGFLGQLRDARGFRAVLDCDGRVHVLRCLQVTIANGIHYGGGMTVSREARLDDGLLDVLAIRPQGRMRLLLRGLALRSGNAAATKEVEAFRCRRLMLRTRRPMPVTADGEEVTRTPLECEVLPKALRVYVPEGAAA